MRDATQLVLPLFADGVAPTHLVGGKAASLMRMARAGLPVPPGAVLTSWFFAPWFARIKDSSAWAAWQASPEDTWPEGAPVLAALAAELDWTDAQRQALDEARQALAASGDGVLVAVRSSSPEEDLESASFAGVYDSFLGIQPGHLEEAVRRCFRSSLDERVFSYKRTRGFDVSDPRLAVVVQRQLASEVAGVAFSINPLTNDYDEAAVDANWGLGESVVSGNVSADHFVVDKVARRVLERKLGGKETSTWLLADGGTEMRTSERAGELCLDDGRLLELVDALIRIEALYGRPMDIEWAFADGALHVLQARPITAYVPLAPEMMTEPGAPRMLYLDQGLSDAMTINAPLSPLGNDWMLESLPFWLEPFVGPVKLRRDAPPQDSLFFNAGARMYLNLSHVLSIIGPETLAKSTRTFEPLMADLFAGIDRERYRSGLGLAGRMRWLLRWIPRLVWHSRRMAYKTLRAAFAPRRAHAEYVEKAAAYERAMRQDVDYRLPVAEFVRRANLRLMRIIHDAGFPVLFAFLRAGLGAIDRLVAGAPESVRDLADRVKRGFPGELVVEMGIALHRLAQSLDARDFDDLDQLAARLAARDLPQPFLAGWDAFVDRYGFRGPLEMDPANPTYGDDPRLALDAMAAMATGDFDPAKVHQRHVAERRQALAELMTHFRWYKRRKLKKCHEIIELFAGTRDTPKYHLILFKGVFRRRVLIEGRRLVEEGRLDAPEQVFGLTMADLNEAGRDAAMDLRARHAERMQFFHLLKDRVQSFPLLIDSRGLILRARRPGGEAGVLVGAGVSRGVVTGPVKVLHDPREKRVAPGDVLVAFTADPGWTPLFANAAAVVLEVGGMLQHGAIVAREYGKPCVTGVEGAVSKLRDGQLVEVDGTRGRVRILASQDHAAVS